MDKKELIKTAHLACLSLSEKEEAEFTAQLKKVFEYFNQISSIGTEGVEPLVHPSTEMSVPLREDQVRVEEEEREKLLQLAPERLGNEYKVPPVLE